MITLDRCSKIAELITAVIISISAVLAIKTYIHQVDVSKKEFTISTASYYLSPSMQKDKSILFQAILEVQENTKPVKLGAADIGLFISKHNDFPSGNNTELIASMISVASFYNSAKTCVESNLCDRHLLEKLVGDDANALSCAFRLAFLELSRASNVPDIMGGISFFGTKSC